MRDAGFKIYLLFVVSWFLHLGTRIPFLGSIRFDLLLILVLSYLAFTQPDRINHTNTTTDKLIKRLLIYALVTLPFVEWPGSVINSGLQEWVKAAVFYWFTVAFIVSERKLLQFMVVFLFCQLWRILEPLYLHLTEGYWGSIASMANWEFMDRLSGAPHDIVNPNGLAFIVCTVLPFLYFFQGLSWWSRLVFLGLTPATIYTLMLTGSRSGFLGLEVIFLGIVWKSRRRLLIAVLGVTIAVAAFPFLSADMQDRYLSIFGAGEKNAATAQGRLEGVEGDLRVIMRRPFFGHGLGTSREANANFRGGDQPAHNLYTETGQELGIFGLLILLALIRSIVINFNSAQSALARRGDASGFLKAVVDAMQVWLVMNLLFSFASYGLSSYEWYLFAGLSVALYSILNVADLNRQAGEAHERHASLPTLPSNRGHGLR